MGPIDDLARDAGVATEHVGGLVLVPTDHVGRLLEAFKRAGIRVLGAEGFVVSGSEARPDMDAILDLSDVEDTAESVREAQDFFERVASHGLLFDFVIDESSLPP